MIYLQRSKLALLGIGVAMLAGCGGGSGGQGGSGSGPIGQSQTTTIGQGAVTYIGQPKPRVTASSGSVTVSGLAGATFTALNVNQAPVLDNTYFAYSRTVNGTSAIFTFPYAGGVEQLLSHDANGGLNPAISKTGYIAYSQPTVQGGFLMRADGSSNKQLTLTGSSIFSSPSVSPYANYIAFDGTGDGLYYAPLSGGTATLIQNNDQEGGTSWEPNNSTVAYVVYSPAGYDNIYTTPITGGTPTNVTPPALQTTGNWYQPSCSSDGVSIAATYTPTGSSNREVVVFATNSSHYITITPSGYSDSCPTFSPDGLSVAFYRSSTGGATPGIYISDYIGENERLVYPDPATSRPLSNLCWSPFPYAQLLLGAGSNLYNGNVNGFLLSQNGSQFGSVCGFTTATASTASISTPTGASGQPLVFTLSGDNVTMIEYTNSFFNLHGETLIQPTGTNPSALVSVDAYTGQIDMVATAASAMGQSSSKISGANLTYTAKFTAIYDKNGKNLAPSGAKQVVVNPTTGKLISFQ